MEWNGIEGNSHQKEKKTMYEVIHKSLYGQSQEPLRDEMMKVPHTSSYDLKRVLLKMKKMSNSLAYQILPPPALISDKIPKNVIRQIR